VTTAELAQWVRARPQLAAGGAGLIGVVVLVVAGKHRSSTPATTLPTAASDQAALAAQTAGLSGTPNTAGVDQASSFSDALTAISQQLDQLGGGGTTTAPAGSPADSRAFMRFYDAANSHAVYLIENGHAEWLNPAQWAEFVRQGAKVQGGSVLDNIWQTVAPVQAPANGVRLPAPILHTPAPGPLNPPAQRLPQQPSTGVRPQTASYTLRPGESLHDAASAVYGPERAGAMASAIAAHNSIRTTVTSTGQNIAHIYPGQQLRMP
jgi:hypothetical protein